MNRAGSAEPPVSIILPTLDERDCIVDCLSSVLTQDYPTIDEVLVVDGGSSDGTPELARGLDDRVRVVGNPRTTAAAAMNIGLAEARNDLVVRLDAHTIYAPDYVRRSVATLTESGAAIAGGPMRPVGRTSFGRAVAAVTTSPIGIGNGRFHYATEACDVETVYLGIFDRRTIAAAGGYDEDGIQWAAEDQELAFQVVTAGWPDPPRSLDPGPGTHPGRCRRHCGSSIATTASARRRRCASTVACRTSDPSSRPPWWWASAP